MNDARIWEAILPIFTDGDSGLAVYSREKIPIISCSRGEALLSRHGDDPEDRWRFADCSLDALLHRVLDGHEREVAECATGDDGSRIQLRVTRVDTGTAAPVAVLVMSPVAGRVSGSTSRAEILARLLPGIAHEIRSPLTTVSGVAQVAATHAGLPDDIREHLNLVRGQVERADRVLRSASAYARGPRNEEQLPVSLNEGLRRALDLIAYELRGRRLDPELDLGNGLPLLHVDPEDLQHLLLALLEHLIRETKPVRGRDNIHLRTRAVTGRRAELRIAWPPSRPHGLTTADLAAEIDIARALGGELAISDADTAVITLGLSGTEGERPPRQRTILAADPDLDHLLVCLGELRTIGGPVRLATTPQVTAANIRSGAAMATVVDCSFAEEMRNLRLPSLSVLSARPGLESRTRTFAREMCLDWAPQKDAPARLRELLSAGNGRGTPFAFPEFS